MAEFWKDQVLKKPRFVGPKQLESALMFPSSPNGKSGVEMWLWDRPQKILYLHLSKIELQKGMNFSDDSIQRKILIFRHATFTYQLENLGSKTIWKKEFLKVSSSDANMQKVSRQ